MPGLHKVLFGVMVAGSLVALSTSTEAQLVRKAVNKLTEDVRETRRDYRTDKPFQYSPDDPDYRGKLFRLHTVHYGYFYNCDGEECKRNSPYICWKTHHEPDFPRLKPLRFYIQQDLDNIRWRVGNGGCCPGELCHGCSQCSDNWAVGNSLSTFRPLSKLQTAKSAEPQQPEAAGSGNSFPGNSFRDLFTLRPIREDAHLKIRSPIRKLSVEADRRAQQNTRVAEAETKPAPPVAGLLNR